MVAYAVFFYSFIIIWGLFWPPMGWLLSLSVIIYLIYEFFKANARKINKEAPRDDSYLQKGRIQSKERESNNYPKSNQVKAVLNPNELVSKADALKKFADLRDQGIITAEEFYKKKEQISVIMKLPS